MGSLIQPRLLRKMTVRRILEVLQGRGPSSRADLTRHTGISAPTVSKAVASLLASGLLEEGEAPDGSVGRPGRLLRLATERAQVLGIVLDARRCWVGAAGLDGRLRPEAAREIATPKTYAALLDAVARAARPLMAARGVTTLGAGISTPGLINRRTKEVVLSPNLRFTNRHSPERDLGRRLGIACVMFQESHALCLGERMVGAARDLNDFALLDVSTGMGLGVMSGGKLLTGHSGLAGELGHVVFVPGGRPCGCGNRGCLETVATDSALAALVSERLGRRVDIDEVIRLLRAGELEAAGDLDQVSEYLATAMAAVINLFNPATLFVHGQLFAAQEGLFARVAALARRRALAPSAGDCPIIQARGSKRQGAVAGIIHHLTHAQGPSVGA